MSMVIERNALLRPRVQKHRRLNCAIDVEVVGEVISERARSHDLSASGMFVDSAQDYVPGMRLRLRFTIDRHELDLPAEVIHHRQQVGFGARFLDLAPADRRRLLRYVHRERATREAARLLDLRRAGRD